MGATERLRWRLVDLIDRLLPGQCWPGLVSWALDGPRHERRMGNGAVPWRPINSTCRSELPRTGTCYCGALRRDVPKLLADQLRTECCHAPVALGPCMRGPSDEEFWVYDLRCAACGRDAGSFVESWARPSREDTVAGALNHPAPDMTGIPHGTAYGYQCHLGAGEQPCARCTAAFTELRDAGVLREMALEDGEGSGGDR